MNNGHERETNRRGLRVRRRASSHFSASRLDTEFEKSHQQHYGGSRDTRSIRGLPKGWYYSYVSDELGYCPTRVWGLDELPADEAMANLYAQGNRWVVVFSDATGPRGDRTFIHIDSFDADAMMANRLKEVDALQELADMGYRLDALGVNGQ